ncbi:cation diffusion facilitator family transporter [Methanobacterium alcaliphilum]|uniref:cation diffusion facilitator family transporter n=1 Tax=Methanobacterium alcaliphilum TaxID=392018 RepID=UPI00200AD65A|nr:cation diffusion facilitator family transporter [Methanobacterium alcaliphilum]
MESDLERKKMGTRASFVAIFGNIMLTLFNLIVGIYSGSTALVAEGAHTLSDVITSFIAFIGFKIGMKPADDDHHYGHGRAEPIVGLIIVIFLLVVAYEILSDVYLKIVIKETLNAPDLTAALMAIIGIGINIVMTRYLLKTGEKINSPALIADGHHQKVDIYSCFAILAGVIGAHLGFPILDPLVAIFIALMVLKTAFSVGKDSVNNIMGKIPSQDIIEKIREVVISTDNVQGVHDIKINYMGPYASAEMHIELYGDMILWESHKIAHEVEKCIIKEVKPIKSVSVHTCPVEEND